jgi:hypothetical protein
MNKFALFAVAGLAVAAPVQASAISGHINGYEVRIRDSGSYSGLDVVDVYGPEGLERITLTCAPFDWTSHGPNTVEFVDSIARSWCF